MNQTSPAATSSRDRSEFRRILSRNVAVPLGAGLLSAILFALIVGYLTEVLARVEQTDRVIISAGNAEKLVIDMETGMRGYLLTGQTDFLGPYQNAVTAFAPLLSTLHELTVDPQQEARLNEIGQLQRDWVAYAERAIATRRSGGSVTDLVRSREGLKRTTSMRQLFDDYINQERRQRIERNDAASHTANLLIASFLGISMLISAIIAWRGRRELITLSDIYDSALADQQAHAAQLELQAWQRGGQTQLAERLMGQLPLTTLSDNTLAFLAEYLDVAVAALYTRDSSGDLRLSASYGLTTAQRSARALLPAGDGLTARCVQDRRVIELKGLDAGYLQLSSGVVEGPAKSALLVPIGHEGSINGVLELGFLRPVNRAERELAESLATTVGASIEAARYRERLHTVLEETQQLNEELQAQQEELRSANEELEAQARVLQESQAHLEEQQAQLEQANEQLAERGEELLAQRDALNERNSALREAQQQLEDRAQELAQASRYKSEFLANMSHELRTPLNSSLILARLLADNAVGNLSKEQVRYAESIYSAGNDLLALINDILDISKVEAGKLDVHPAPTPLTRLTEGLESTFRAQAAAKGLGFQLVVEEGTPENLVTDRQRLEQILRNLLSNAVKFTEQGSVSVTVGSHTDTVLFQVRDTGIGIAPEQQALIFDAFHQADGTISRRFGGTGLGLSISRDLARLLGGDLTVSSEAGVGSTFTLALPRRFAKRDVAEPSSMKGAPLKAPPASQHSAMPVPAASHVSPLGAPPQLLPAVPDDRDQELGNRRCVLVIEDEPTFAQILRDLAHELGYACLVAGSADEGVALAQQFKPHAVLLDMKLPDHSGLTVLERLKAELGTRHIPVHVISVEDRWQPAMQLGAVGYAMKPTSRDELKAIFARLEARLEQKVKRVLLVEDDARQREAITLLISDDDVEIVAVESGAQALGQLQSTVFDCMIVDLQLTDMQGKELLDAMTTAEICSFPPIIVYTGRNLSAEEEAELMRYSRSIIIKGARSPERLLDEVTLFLHKVESDLSVERRTMLETARNRDRAIEGRRILLVDDDVRNLFALTSALESKGAQIEIARNGREALEKLEAVTDIDLVLMDVMMPEMDGYEAMQAIRAEARWRRLPIIAVTAKAMKDDQERCLQAGANDYMAKPIDLNRLFSLIRVWLPKLERV